MLLPKQTVTRDASVVSRVYAALALLIGVVVAAWGPPWLGTAVMTRIFGAMVAASGCWAAMISQVEDPAEYFHALYWFSSGHYVILLVVVLERTALWGPGRHHAIENVLWTAFFVPLTLMSCCAKLLQGKLTRRELLKAKGAQTFVTQAKMEAILRSRYEQQIRLAGAQEERNRLARDLHDSIKQQIFVIQTAAATAQRRFESDREGTASALDQIRSSARDAMTEMEVMMDQLRSVPLENAGLVDALKKQCEALGHRTGARVDFRLGDLPPNEALPPGSHQAILRAAQEALANIGRHARANNVTVSLDSIGDLLQLRVQDDGAGFDPLEGQRGMGIANMRARADEFGGEFDLSSRPGRGTTVTFSIPYDETPVPTGYRKWTYLYGAGLVVFLLAEFYAPGAIFLIAVCAIGLVSNLRDWRRAKA
jgi:signal transduction histidine kinase